MPLYKKDIVQYIKNNVDLKHSDILSPNNLIYCIIKNISDNVPLIWAFDKNKNKMLCTWQEVFDNLGKTNILIHMNNNYTTVINDIITNTIHNCYIAALKEELKPFINNQPELDKICIYVDKYIYLGSVRFLLNLYMPCCENKYHGDLGTVFTIDVMDYLFRSNPEDISYTTIDMLNNSIYEKSYILLEFYLKSGKIFHFVGNTFELDKIKPITSFYKLTKFSAFVNINENLKSNMLAIKRTICKSTLSYVIKMLMKESEEEGKIINIDSYNPHVHTNILLTYSISYNNDSAAINISISDSVKAMVAQRCPNVSSINYYPGILSIIGIVFNSKENCIEIVRKNANVLNRALDSNIINNLIKNTTKQSYQKFANKYIDELQDFYEIIITVAKDFFHVISNIDKCIIDNSWLQDIYSKSSDDINETQKALINNYVSVVEPISDKSILDIATILSYKELLTKEDTDYICLIGTIRREDI